MKAFRFVLAILAASLVCAWANATPKAIVLGTATKGGGFEVYGRHLAAVLTEFDKNLRIDIRPTRGSAENLALLEAGKIDIGLVEGNAVHEAVNAINGQKRGLRIITATYPGPGMFVVRADSPYHTINDLKGHAVAFGTPASGLTKLGRDVLKGLDLSLEYDFNAVFLTKAGDGPALVRERKVAALWGGGIGWPGFVALANAPGGARFIVPSADEIARIRKQLPHLQRMTVPAGSYAGQEKSIESLGLWSYVLARADLRDETAYRLVRALHKGEAKLAARLAQGRYTTTTNTAINRPSVDLLHAGVRRYLREIGALR